MTRTAKLPKHRQVYESLRREILSGRYMPGDRLSSEAALVQKFQTSRITIGRALRDLQREALIERRVGSGTYVSETGPAGKILSFGLLIPDLGQTEIFEPICQGMAQAPTAAQHALLWGSTGASTDGKEEQAWQLCQQYIARKVAGVFFAPLELTPLKDEANHRIVAEFEKARIPVVLLDRCVAPYPYRSQHDLVGIDNRRAGYMITDHLLKLGVRRIAFVSYPLSASTVEARIAGYREALFANGAGVEPSLIYRLDPTHTADIQELMQAGRPEAFVCANDRTAGRLMRTLLELGYSVPKDVRLVGIDDVEYASLLPVPLTTVHQPCQQIGETAMSVMLERIASPNIPTRDILLDCRLEVRQSCGAQIA